MEGSKMYSVKGYDSFSHEHFDVGKYKTLDEAKQVAYNKAGEMTLMYVYDKRGVQLAKYGTF